MKKGKKIKNVLKLKINFDGFKLDVVSDDPNKTLYELKSLINSKKELIEAALPTQDGLELYDYLEDESLDYDLNTRRFTSELKENKEYIDAVRNLFLKHKNFIYRKERIEAKQEIDLTNKRLNMIIDKKDINMLIKKLVFNISSPNLKHVFVHVISDTFSKEHQSMFLDEIKKRTGFPETSFVLTQKKLNGVVVAEALFFGDFPAPQEPEF